MAQNKGVITIQKPYLGWTPSLTSSGHVLESTTGITSQLLVAYPSPEFQDYSYSYAISPNIPGYEGDIAAGPQFTNVTDNSGVSGGVINGLALNAVTAPDGNCYVLLDSNRYVMLNLSTKIISSGNYNSVGSAVGIHAGHSGFTTVNGDIAIYPVTFNGFTNYRTYATWDDGTDADIAQLSGNTVVAANYYTGTLSGSALVAGVPHPILTAMNIDKNVYFGNGSNLGMFNPITPAHTDQALILPAGWIINGLATYGDYIAIIAYRMNNFSSNQNPLANSQTKLYLWDGYSPVPNFQYDIQDNFVSNIFNDGKDLYVITYGRNATVKLKQFNGQSFDILWESAIIGGFPGGTTSPNPCFGGMDLWLNHIVWSSNSRELINGYGSPSAQYPKGFHNLTAQGGTNGMCKNLYGNTLFIGNKDINSHYTIKYSDLTTSTVGATFMSSLYPLPTNSAITYVKLYASYWPSANSFVNVAIVKDYNGISFGEATDLLNWQPSGSANQSYFSKSITIDNVNSFYLSIYFGGEVANQMPIIRKIEVGFSYDDDNI